MSHPEDEEFEDMEFDDIDDLWDEDLEDTLDEPGIEVKSEEHLSDIAVDENMNLEPEETLENVEEAAAKPEKKKKEKPVKEIDPNAPKKKIGVMGPLLLLSILGGAGFVVYSTILNPPKPQIIPAITAQTPQPVLTEQNDVIEDNAAFDQTNMIVEETSDLSFDQAPQETAPISDDQVLTPFPEMSDTEGADDMLPSLSFEDEESMDSSDITINPFGNDSDITTSDTLDEDNMLLKTEGIIEDMPAFPEDAADADTSIAHELDFNIEPVNINDLDVEKAIRVEPEIEEAAPADSITEENQKSQDDLTPVEEITEQVTDVLPIEEMPQEKVAPIDEPQTEALAVQPVKKPEVAKKVEAPKPIPAPTPKINWVIRAAQPGKAVISDNSGTLMQSIEVGDKVNGIGTVKSIAKSSGKWVIQGTNGKISQ